LDPGVRYGDWGLKKDGQVYLNYFYFKGLQLVIHLLRCAYKQLKEDIMVYSEELKIRDAQLTLTEHENLELLLDDYIALNEMLSENEKSKEPLERKILKLKHKVSLIDSVIRDCKWRFWIKHLKDLERVSKMNEFIYGKFSTIETEIRKLASKKEEEK